MVRTAQIGRRLTQKRRERRYWQQAVQSAHAPQTVANPAAYNPAGTDRPFYETATMEEWLAAFTEWTEGHRALPTLPEQNYNRAYFYEDIKC